MYQKPVVSVKQFSFTKRTFFSCQTLFLAHVLTSPAPSFPGRGDTKGELPPTFGLQRNRMTFDIVAKTLQGPSNTLAAGFLLKIHPWTQLRGNMIKQEKQKTHQFRGCHRQHRVTDLSSSRGEGSSPVGVCCSRGAGTARGVMPPNVGLPALPRGLQPGKTLPDEELCFSDVSSDNDNFRVKLLCHLPSSPPQRCRAETSARSQ